MDIYDDFFDNICKKNYKNVYKYILFSVKNRDAVNDIVQEVFIVVYKNIEKLYSYEKPEGFIYRTAQNLVKNYKKELYKKIKKEISIDDNVIDIVDYKNTIENNIDSKINEYEYITEVIDSLSEDNKKIYNMYYNENLSIKEIAEREGCEYTAMRMRFTRLRRLIKERVKEISEKYFVT